MNDAWDRLNESGYRVYYDHTPWWHAARYTVVRSGIVLGCTATLRGARRVIAKDKTPPKAKATWWETSSIVHEEK